jgi:hypothetical protein
MHRTQRNTTTPIYIEKERGEWLRFIFREFDMKHSSQPNIRKKIPEIKYSAILILNRRKDTKANLLNHKGKAGMYVGAP